eukprot:gb/GFBE01070577.1/.p1 GENE.gb/GFBE01070577.1/~~gb/GFBE01070577.1/.p1  ORF type:complete len:243 (+),score=59.51 gb/GFBE01070577.1/:1-729(+)
MAMDTGAPMELEVDLGPMPNEDNRDFLLSGLRGLLDRRELCDVALVAAGGEVFHAHRAVLAACSPVFREKLPKLGGAAKSEGYAEAEGLPALRLEVKHAEALKALLDSVYGVDAKEDAESQSYNPSSEAANLDALKLAREFQIYSLEDQAARWLARGLTTQNILKRLAACEEFGLKEVKEKILEQLTANTDVLHELVSDPAVREMPGVLQDLLLRVLHLLGCGPAGMGATATQDQPARKAGA